MNRIVINLDEWKKKNAKKTGTLEDYTFQEIKNFLYPVAKNMYSADRQEKDYLYDMIKGYPHYEHDGVCTFLAVDMETLAPEFPDPVFVDIKAKISWGFSKDTLFNTANYWILTRMRSQITCAAASSRFRSWLLYIMFSRNLFIFCLYFLPHLTLYQYLIPTAGYPSICFRILLIKLNVLNMLMQIHG